MYLSKEVDVDILKFLVAIDGVAQLWSLNANFLGLLSSDQYHCNSIINPKTYGSSYCYSSIQNPGTPYGGTCGMYSPYNLTSSHPPVVVYQSRVVLVVTKNADFQTDGLPIVDPDLMLGVYARRANSRPEPVEMGSVSPLSLVQPAMMYASL